MNMKTNSIGALVLLGASLAGSTALAGTAQLVESGSAAERINLVFMAAGYTPAEQADFETEVRENLERLWGGAGVTGIPWFIENRERFDVYQVVDDWSLPLDPVNFEARSFISAITSPAGLDRRYDQGLTNRNIHIAILNRTGGDAGAKGGWIQITNQTSQEHTLAHEIGIHVLGTSNWGPAGQPIYDDEYIDASRCDTGRHSKFVLNANDRASDDKWSHDVDGNPLTDTASILGGWYCNDTFYRPYSDSIANHPGPGGSAPFGFGALGRMILDIGLGKRLGLTETTRPSIGPGEVDGVAAGETYAGVLDVVATPSDASGIYRVDFYWGRAGDVSRSLKSDINEYDEDGSGVNDYRIGIDTTGYADGSYWLDVIAWDKNLNYRRVSTNFNLDNTAPRPPENLQVD